MNDDLRRSSRQVLATNCAIPDDSDEEATVEQVHGVIRRLVDYLWSRGFVSADTLEQHAILENLAANFRSMLYPPLSPMRILTIRMSTGAIVDQILRQAEARDVVSAIAKLIVGTTLELSLNEPRSREVAAQHKWATGYDDPSALGDYRIENVAIVVTMAREPDESHCTKVETITWSGDECWLIVRSDQLPVWLEWLAQAPIGYPTLVQCFGISQFIGQNIMERRLRSTVPSDPLREVIVRLNEIVARLSPQSLPAARVEIASWPATD